MENLDQSHHAFVLVFEEMAVIGKHPYGVWIAEVHSNANAGVGKRMAIVVGDVYRVAEKVLLNGYAHVMEQQKVQLMDVKCMQLTGAILNDPVFDCSLLCDDVWDVGVHVEHLRGLSVDGEVELDCAGGIVRVGELL